ncbi:MAG: winged helix-turn-helix domain-containing protein, partial [Chloroflexi bacterium]|nr:winged helix-turn-helix domain-containing protein [Chloroflexota bacterium]
IHSLMKNSGQIVIYSDLAEEVWGEEYPGSVDSLRVHIRRLREKIEENPGRPRIILTKTGLGYYLGKPESF